MASPQALALLVFVPAVALAADLGRLTVLSGVGEPLRAEIEILALSPGEAASLAARIPPPDLFWRANLEPPAVLDSLRARVEPRPKGRYVVMLRSSKPIEDPFMQLLVELDSSAGRVVREYPFLLEEPREQDLRAAAGSPPAAAEGIPRRRAELARDRTYVVEPGDTLAGIARVTRPADATVEQTIVALYQANEQAFVGGNMNRLPAGAVLALPDEGAAQTIAPADAHRVILAHRAAFDAAGRHASARVIAGTVPSGGAPAPGARGATPRPAPADQLRLTRPEAAKGRVGSADAARDDDIAALQRALAEAQERIALLQRGLEDVRKLLALKEQQLGGVERTERASAEPPPRILGDAIAAEQRSDRRGETRPLHSLVREYGPWLLATLLFGFTCWVVMPLKTVRAWRKRRRRRERETMKIALGLPRTPRRAVGAS
jgi:pilus assembly protein FimV